MGQERQMMMGKARVSGDHRWHQHLEKRAEPRAECGDTEGSRGTVQNSAWCTPSSNFWPDLSTQRAASKECVQHKKDKNKQTKKTRDRDLDIIQRDEHRNHEIAQKEMKRGRRHGKDNFLGNTYIMGRQCHIQHQLTHIDNPPPSLWRRETTSSLQMRKQTWGQSTCCSGRGNIGIHTQIL